MIPAAGILDQLPGPVYVTDADGAITYFNAAAAEAWGRTPELGKTRWCGSLRLFTREGEPLEHADCPVAVSLRQGAPVADQPMQVERPDGSRKAFLSKIRLMRDAAGKVLGAIVMAEDASGGSVMERERLAAIVASSADVIISKDIDGRVATWNAAATRVLGYTAEEMIGQPVSRIIPPDRLYEEELILARIRRGETVEPYDTVRRAKDGRLVDLSITVSPLRDRDGRIVGASKIARDITERKRFEDTQTLLIEELNHRVRNTLAMIRAMARESFRRADNPRDFVEKFNGRLNALAQAHDLLVERNMRGAAIGDLVRVEVALDPADLGRISHGGPEVELPAQVAVHLALVLHELFVNARRHGALSHDAGRLAIAWDRVTGDRPGVELHWKESGGRRVAAPAHPGFGLRMIEQSLASNEAEVRLQFEPDGLRCQLFLPLYGYGGGAAEPEAARPQQPGDAPEAVGDAPLDGLRVLVVEDEILIAMELEAILREVGSEPLDRASSVDEAHRRIAEGGFDVVLLDGNLNGRPSGEIAAELAERGIPFAYATGYGRAALPEGFRDRPLLSKPFSATEVRRVLRALRRGTG